MLKFGNTYLNYNGKYFIGHSAEPFKSIKLGNQTWMAEDLQIDDGLGGISSYYNSQYVYIPDAEDMSVSGTYPATALSTQHNDKVTIYTIAAAKRVASSISGWHLPTWSEWVTLGNYLYDTYGENKSVYSVFKPDYDVWDSLNKVEENIPYFNKAGFNAIPVMGDRWNKDLWDSGVTYMGYSSMITAIDPYYDYWPHYGAKNANSVDVQYHCFSGSPNAGSPYATYGFVIGSKKPGNGQSSNTPSFKAKVRLIKNED